MRENLERFIESNTETSMQGLIWCACLIVQTFGDQFSLRVKLHVPSPLQLTDAVFGQLEEHRFVSTAS